MFKYQELIDKLQVEDVNSAIKRMVDNYDLTGKYYGKDEDDILFLVHRELFFEKYCSLSPDFLKYIEIVIQKEFNEQYQIEWKSIPLEDIDFDILDSSTPEEDIKKRIKDKIYCTLLDYLESKAKKILDNREFLRIPAGSTVDFKECMLFNKYLGKVEFYKDGGWGIAEEDGTVLVKNHLTRQPSKTYSLYCGISNINTPYRVIQDRDTNKYGILSYESFYETIHCLYDKIEVIDYYDNSTRHFFIKAMKRNKWGCFDEKCALIIDFEYDIIQIVSAFLECIREAEYHLDDSLSERDRRYVVEGKRDLYDNEGVLLIGGYDNLLVDYQYLKFYFGTSYEYYEEEETDFQGYPVPLSKVRLNFEKSKCLVLDKEFKTIISNGNGLFRMPKGHKFSSLEDVESFVPSGYLLRYSVDLSDYNALIYLYNFYGEQYLVPDYIKEGFATPEEQDNFRASHINSYNERRKKLENMLGEGKEDSDIDMPFDYSEPTEYPYENRQDLYVDDSIVTILMLNSKKEIARIDYVNEIVEKMYYPHIYRKGKKYGIIDGFGLKPACFDAITRETPDHKTYLASFEYCRERNRKHLNNPNYIYERRLYIHYYVLDENGSYIKVEDDWKVFNPRDCKWFPYDFIARYYGDYDDGAYDYHSDGGYEWTDEDAWDAMTDGMYGDYPGSGWDPEAFGY